MRKGGNDLPPSVISKNTTGLGALGGSDVILFDRSRCGESGKDDT